MIGALAIKNRRKKRLGSQTPTLPPARNVFMERCHLLFVAGGVFFIVGLILMIPGFFGDTNFFIYSGSSFGVGVVIFLLACLLSPADLAGDDESGENPTQPPNHLSTTPTMLTNASPSKNPSTDNLEGQDPNSIRLQAVVHTTT